MKDVESISQLKSPANIMVLLASAVALAKILVNSEKKSMESGGR